MPLQAVFYDGNKGKISVFQEGITLSRKGIIITAFGENRDGEGLILRFWEETGKSGTCTVNLPKGSNFKKAFACNLRGEIIDKKRIPISNDTFQFMIKAYQPVSYILK